MENIKINQQTKRSLSTFSSFQVLWSSDKSTKEAPSVSNRSLNGIDGAANVQVVLRCRPMNEKEKQIKTNVAISCNEYKGEVSVVQDKSNHQMDKSFIFDGVFGPKSLQNDLFEQVVVPIIDLALEGYTCTILAHGQSGTGKTYTMEGEGNMHKDGVFDDGVGVIPRAVQQIFYVLGTQKAEYNMKVMYLELYNEDITDLLVDKNLEANQKKSISIMEDGEGNVYLRGLEEIEVKGADEVYKILHAGSMKKHTAETFSNEKSNRSHSIFSISINMKECFQDGVELLKCGKLNFVDLAGSENILRSRARESGMINKSLLTFGRVINALAENSNHVPYRDSKLTRLLRDSLGGRTKTCLIATISPSISCLEETLNTLEYAHRSKNIKNKPEVNQKVLRSALFNNLYSEIDHLKRELHATREKNGIYIPKGEYLIEQAAKKAMLEKVKRIELDLGLKEEKAKEIQELLPNQQKFCSDLSERHKKTQREFARTVKALAELEEKYQQANRTIQEKEYLIYNLLGSEKGLSETVFQLRAELENAASEVSSLLQDIDCKVKKEGANRGVILKFRAQLITQLQALHKIVSNSVTKQEQQLKAIEEDAQLFFSGKCKATDQLIARVEELKVVYGSGLKKSEDLAEEINKNLQLAYDSLKAEVPKHSESVMDKFCFKGGCCRQ